MLWWSRVMLSMPACLCKRDEQGVREELAARSAAAQTGISDNLEIYFFEIILPLRTGRSALSTLYSSVGRHRQTLSNLPPIICCDKCAMPAMESLISNPHRRLVGQPLLYAISVFASLGVFLVSVAYRRSDDA